MMKIPDKFTKQLMEAGETGMGYLVVNIVLKDGRQINQVAIVDGRIAQIRGMDKIPFKEDDIEKSL